MAGKPGRRGWGHIQKPRTSGGRWEASYMHLHHGALRRFRAPRTFDSKLAAEGWLASERRLIDTDTWTPPKERARTATKASLSLGEFADQAIAARALEPTTRANYERLLDTRIRPHLGDRPIASITADDLEAWWQDIDDGHATTRAHAWNLMRSLLRAALDDNVVHSDPSDDPRFQRYGRRRKRRPDTPLLTPTEIDEIAAQLPSEYGIAVSLMAWCGLRFAELTELRVKDLDERPDGLVLKIRRSAPLVNGRPTVKGTKSEAGIRDVWVPPHLATELRQHVKLHKRRRPSDLIVTSTRGTRLSQRTFTKPFKAALPAQKKHFRVHDLRHTGAVLSAQAGATTAELMERLGHATPGMALHYQHVADGRQRQIADRLSAMITPNPSHVPE